MELQAGAPAFDARTIKTVTKFGSGEPYFDPATAGEVEKGGVAV
jgi:hypothetical protein